MNWLWGLVCKVIGGHGYVHVRGVTVHKFIGGVYRPVQRRTMMRCETCGKHTKGTILPADYPVAVALWLKTPDA